MAGVLQKEFTQEYRDQAFGMWYASHRCSLNSLVSMLPENDDGDRPAIATVSGWKARDGWAERAANLDVEVQTRLERELVGQRVEMMKRHAEFAMEIIDSAMEKLRADGFDTSASAVAALRMSFDEEKKSRGMEVALTRIAEMDDEQLQKTFITMLGQVSGVETVDGDVEDIEEPTVE